MYAQPKKRAAMKAKPAPPPQRHPPHVREMGQHISRLEHQIHDMKISNKVPVQKTIRRQTQERRDPKREHLRARYCSFNGSAVPRLMPDGTALFQPDAMIKDFNTYVYDDKQGTGTHFYAMRSLLITTNFGVSNTVGMLIQWQRGATSGNTNIYAMPITCNRIPADLTAGTAPSGGLADTCTIALQNTTADRFVQGPVSVAALESKVDSNAPAGLWPIGTWDSTFDNWRTLPQPRGVRMNASDFRSAKTIWSYPRDNVLYNSFEKFFGNYGGPAWDHPLPFSDPDPTYPPTTVGDRVTQFMNHIISNTSSSESSTTPANRLPMSYNAFMIEQIGNAGEMTSGQIERQQSYSATATGTWLFRYPQNNPLSTMQRDIPNEPAAKIVHQRNTNESAGATIAVAAGAAVVAGAAFLLTRNPAAAEAAGAGMIELTEPLLAGVPAAIPAESGLGGAMMQNFRAVPEQWASGPPPPRRRRW